MINIGLIGYGYWGPNVARNFSHCRGTNLLAICDQSETRLKMAKARYPSIKDYSDPNDLLNSDDLQLAAIVTPVYSHYDLAKAALEAGKHIFVEKPFTSNARQAEELINLAHKKGLLIMVDHTFLFTGAVKKIREIVDSHELGSLFFYDSTRVNLGLFQHDINVVWDLAPHDFSIMNYLIGNLDKVLKLAGQHIALTLVALAIAVGIAVPLGVLVARRPRAYAPVMGWGCSTRSPASPCWCC